MIIEKSLLYPLALVCEEYLVIPMRVDVDVCLVLPRSSDGLRLLNDVFSFSNEKLLFILPNLDFCKLSILQKNAR